MYEDLKGKKLLIVGSYNESDMVEVAHEMGLYVIVVDNVLDRKVAHAKNVADEAWDISYTDIEAVAAKCREAGVDGVMAGYSEYRIMAAAQISKAIGKPFYATEEQVDFTRNKRLFQEACAKYGIKTPHGYCTNGLISEEAKDKVEYPVIVKPADCNGRVGISVCHDRKQLDEAIELALEKSRTHTYMIEDFLDGTEFSAVYTIKNGEMSLSCLNAKYITKDQRKENFLCDCSIIPAAFVDDFKVQIDAKIKEFLKGMNAINGVANFQGMYTDHGIYLFEMGFRVNGNNDYRSIERENGISFLKMLISYSLCGDMRDDLKKDNPKFSKYYCTLPFYGHAGTIAKLDIDKALKMEDVYLSAMKAEIGNTMTESGTSGQKLFSFMVVAENMTQLKERIKKIQESITVEDENGNNLVFDFFDPSVLEESI